MGTSNLHGRTVSIRCQYIELSDRLILGPPKSRAGLRTVAIPRSIIPELTGHMDRYVRPGDDSLVFTGPRGGVLRRGNFRRGAGWAKAAATLGIPGLHFHDLRHTGNTLAAPGVSLADLKARMGHDSSRAAIIYQHATAEADHAIADALDKRISGTPKGAEDKPRSDGHAKAFLDRAANGTLMARRPRP